MRRNFTCAIEGTGFAGHDVRRGKTLCAETLRPVFKDEKGLTGVPVQPVENDSFRDAICDSVEISSSSMEFLVSPRHQRSALKAGSTEHNRILLFRRNADFINADENR